MQQRADGRAAVIGEYLVGARLERRARTDVYEATHAGTGAPRVLYVLRPGAMGDHPFVHRVVTEADAARWLRHPAGARLESCGDTPSRRLYVAVERAPGRSLADVLAELEARGGRLSLRRVVRLASRLVEALDEAHAVGLAHGRLTPDAVFLGEADAQDGGRELVTLAGLGTAALLDDRLADADGPYVSPEQRAGRAADARSDVYGLAALLARAMGELPGDPQADAAGAGHGGAAGVLAAARAADPAARPATVKALWEDLLGALVAEDAAGGAAVPARAVAIPATIPAPAAALAPAAPTGAPAGSPATVADVPAGSTPTLDLVALDLDALALELLPSLAMEEGDPAAAAVQTPPLAGASSAPAPAGPPPAPPRPVSELGGLSLAAPSAPRPAAPAPLPPPPPPARRQTPPRPRGYEPATWDAPALAAPEPRRASDGRVWWLAPVVVAIAMGWPVVHEARHRAALAEAAREARAEQRARAAAALGDPAARYDRPLGPATVPPRSGLDTLWLPELPPVEIPSIEVSAPGGGMLQRPLVRPDEFAPLVRLPSGGP